MTVVDHATATYLYVGALVDELARAGVRHACICPGSRSTPLALTVAAHPGIKSWGHIDERSAAFFALGLAKASGTPVALVCTSGTAAANFLPAVVEARYSRVPLLILTADRPPELRDNGAPQAIDQMHLYGGNVKWFAEMALPEASEAALRYARTTAARAAATALAGPAGPVHLNLPFRDPLTPPRDGIPVAPYARPNERPYTTVTTWRRGASGGTARDLAWRLAATPRGLIVCGPQDNPNLPESLTRLAARLGYPILADALSGLRGGPHDHTHVCDSYDAMLRDERAAGLTPQVVLRFGATPTSKALLTFLCHTEQHILVDGDGGWRDPTALAGEIIHADAAIFCAMLADELDRQANTEASDRPWPASSATRQQPQAFDDVSWAEHWRDADRRARDAITAYLERLDEPFEGKVFAELAALLPDGATLFAGNSMPVRDLETFLPRGTRAVRCRSNRGANGIDGVVSSALGAAATGDGPLVLVIGDLSFYHDLNGLLAARRHGISATIVLLNNDGGGIFSFLPQAQLPAHFEELFGTPTGLDFRPAVEMYGCGFERVQSWPAFRAAVSASLTSPGVQVIELRTERARNVALHRAVWAAVAEAVWGA